jgi:hypothetical protein
MLTLTQCAKRAIELNGDLTDLQQFAVAYTSTLWVRKRDKTIEEWARIATEHLRDIRDNGIETAEINENLAAVCAAIKLPRNGKILAAYLRGVA